MNCDIDIRQAVDTLRKGGAVLYPTDTVWGIGCDATNEDAVRRVFSIKQRVEAKAMLCLVDSPDRLQRYFRHVPEVAWQLIDCATRPLTLVLQGADGVAPSLLAEDGSLGIRVTSDEFSKQMCYRLQRPIVSTSANISGQPTPSTFKEISPLIVEQMDYVVQFRRGDTQRREPSSIVKLDMDGTIKILRR